MLVYDHALGRIVIWDIDKSEILTDQMFELESVFKNQLIIDEKNKRFALNLSDGNVVATEMVFSSDAWIFLHGMTIFRFTISLVFRMETWVLRMI